MKLLLDTHIWIWGVQEPWKLSSEVARAITQPDNVLFSLAAQYLGIEHIDRAEASHLGPGLR
jgi:PIN domain nuclease of toxin-antitoxin system